MASRCRRSDQRYTLSIKCITKARLSITILTISPKGWIVTPAELRKKYDLQPGTNVVPVDYGGVISIVPAMSDPVEESAGRLKGRRSLTKALLEARAQERQRER